jgi:hypothetical protein
VGAKCFVANTSLGKDPLSVCHRKVYDGLEERFHGQPLLIHDAQPGFGGRGGFRP